jgi:serine/threonine protein kinase
LHDQFDQDELYWVEAESNKEKNVLTKIYVPKNNRIARMRARRERVALNQLTGKIDLDCVPKLLDSNVDTSNNDQPNTELWTIMKLFNGERLSDYIKSNKPDLREALHITRRLLNMIKQIHDQQSS